ncbi:MAG: hypothetical protein U5P41_11420 [Gammaproteobacteria bacterium]|nr:hypothetical protein [Gammaproteobacteria bacterium]
MENTKYRLGWVIFSLFVWLHLAQNILPLPLQRADDIEMQASEAVANSNALAEKGVERDEYMQMSKGGWEAELTASYWSIWIINFLFFLFGLVSTFFLDKNLKIWPVFLGVVSVLCFVYFLLPYVRIESPFIEWTNFMKFALEKSHYSLAYIRLYGRYI